MAYRKQYFKNNKSKYRQTVMNNVKKKKRSDLYTLPKESQYNNFLEIIYDNVRGMLPQNIIDMFCNETITIEVLKEGKANAFLEKKDDTYKVCMTQNLDDLLYWSCRIFSYYPDIMSMEEITSRFLDCLWMLQETGQLKPYCLNNLYGNRYDPTSSIGAVMFYFLHEIGHLMIELNGDMVENSIQNELLADLYAVQIFLGEYSDISLPIEVVYQYIQFSLYTFYAKDMLEDHQALDHPEVEMRIENIDRYILEKYPNYLTILHNIKNPIKNSIQVLPKWWKRKFMLTGNSI